MTSLADIFSEQERTNWLKAQLALYITRSALEKFVDEEIKNIHACIFQSVRSRFNLPLTATCTSCCTANLLRCPTKDVCKKNGQTCVSMHDSPSKQPRTCSINICDAVRDEIIKYHRYGKPSWLNTSAEQWASNHWQIAKCFLPREGYNVMKTAKETDFNGIVNVMLNCKHFDSKMSFPISQHMSTCLLGKVSLEHVN
ncbi:hypothetical protein DPMN_149096 [Dreissena polymorpha]|uniref:Uncharacterized protein n=1 Tax=Dreissena polymorpha TaxID=45954 RepID=A0A9D4FGS9_DREPO|nr:hypothetical protein DPMN_149096 [Dreissena polymorpha]